jgi:Rad52/22 family double-strand break repair protein
MNMIPEELTRKFHPSLVKKNQSGQDYVAIDGYINRLNEVIGHGWTWSINNWKIMDAPPTKSGKPQYIGVVQGTLGIFLSDVGVISMGADDDSFLTTQKAIVYRDGIGANTNFDPDTAVKSAQAEALKKACHQFGIALYLWDAAERDYVELQRRASTDDLALKQLVVAYTNRVLELDPGTIPDKDQMCEVLDIKDLDVDAIRESLTKKGVI